MPPSRRGCALRLLLIFTLLLLPVAPAARGADTSAEPAPDPTGERIHQLILEGDNAGAERVARDRLAEVEAASGPASLEAARALDVVVEVLVWLGSVADPDVLAFAARAVEIKARILGPTHQELARSLNNQANLLWSMGRLTEALPLQERALTIMEAAFAPDHLAVSSYLNDLANLLYDMGEFEGARQGYERAIAIRERNLGPDHFEVARLLVNLGNLYRDTGRLEEARTICERSLTIVEKELGPKHHAVADKLDSLAIVLRDLGNFSSARAYYERAMQIREEALGAESPAFAMSLHNLSDLLQTVGDLGEARRMYERALALREKILGPEHPHLASTLTNFGTLLSEVGDFETAKRLHERALAIWEKALGPEHPHVAAALSNLAEVEAALGSRTTARSLFRRSVETFEKAVGPDHPAIAEVLTHSADLLALDGELGAARALGERALRIRESTLGADHPDVARTLLTLARIDWAERRTEETIQGAMRAEQITRRHFQSTAGALSEREVLAYERIRASGLDLSLTALSSSDKPPDAEYDLFRNTMQGSMSIASPWRDWTLNPALYLTLERQRYRNPTRSPASDEEDRLLTAGLRAPLALRPGSRLRWTLTPELRHEQARRDDAELDPDRRFEARRAGAFLSSGAEWESARGRLILSPSLRWTALSSSFDGLDAGVPDRSDSWSSDTSGKLGLRWVLMEGLALKANAGRFFREPSLGELYGNSGLIQGSPGLDAERGSHADLGLTWVWNPAARSGWLGEARLEGSAFLTRADDLILLFPTGGGTVRPQNSGQAEVTGVELSGALAAAGGLRFDLAFTRQRALDTSGLFGLEGKLLPGRPVTELHAGANLERGRWATLYRYSFIGENYIDRANTRTVPDRHLHTLGLSFSPRPAWQISLEAENLADQRVGDLVGYPLPGRLLTATVRFTP